MSAFHENLIRNQNFLTATIIKSQLELISLVQKIDREVCTFEESNCELESNYECLEKILNKFLSIMIYGDWMSENLYKIPKRQNNKRNIYNADCNNINIFKTNSSERKNFKFFQTKNHSSDGKQGLEYLEKQKLFNRFVKNQVKNQFGEDFLLNHQVRELDFETMQKIKEKAIYRYLPKNITPKTAWHNAMNSLRQMRHQKKKRHNNA